MAKVEEWSSQPGCIQMLWLNIENQIVVANVFGINDKGKSGSTGQAGNI